MIGVTDEGELEEQSKYDSNDTFDLERALAMGVIMGSMEECDMEDYSTGSSASAQGEDEDLPVWTPPQIYETTAHLLAHFVGKEISHMVIETRGKQHFATPKNRVLRKKQTFGTYST